MRARQPTYTYRATIRGKAHGKYLRKGQLCPGNLHSCVVTFELSDGSLATLNTVGATSGYPNGTTGTLVFQGTKCERFDPDK